MYAFASSEDGGFYLKAVAMSIRDWRNPLLLEKAEDAQYRMVFSVRFDLKKALDFEASDGAIVMGW